MQVSIFQTTTILFLFRNKFLRKSPKTFRVFGNSRIFGDGYLYLLYVMKRNLFRIERNLQNMQSILRKAALILCFKDWLNGLFLTCLITNDCQKFRL